LLRRLEQVAQQGSRLGSLVEALILQGLALHTSDHTGPALQVLRRAVALAEPQGFIRLFVDEGRTLAGLLSTLRSRDPASPYLAELLAGDQAVAAPAAASQPLVEPLSSRELETLRLVAAGLSNRQIAAELVVAVGTVKRHLNNIYGKLGVASRTQALAAAAELGLL
jgi:LuxR family transcriptional regulator, maltose regulon positive regulatory protein